LRQTQSAILSIVELNVNPTQNVKQDAGIPQAGLVVTESLLFRKVGAAPVAVAEQVNPRVAEEKVVEVVHAAATPQVNDLATKRTKSAGVSEATRAVAEAQVYIHTYIHRHKKTQP